MISQNFSIVLCLLSLVTISLTAPSATETPCPSCGFRELDPTSTCSTEFESCNGLFPTVYGCVDGTCFRDAYCSCQDVIDHCPSCGFAPDPSGDSAAYCYCETVPSTCGYECPDGEMFDGNFCGCVTAVATNEPPTILTTRGVEYQCLDCGLRKGSTDECDEFYLCDATTGINTAGPFYCNVFECFYEANCICR